MKLAQKVRGQLTTARASLLNMRVQYKSRSNRAVLDEAVRRLEAIIDYTDAELGDDAVQHAGVPMVDTWWTCTACGHQQRGGPPVSCQAIGQPTSCPLKLHAP